jgi:hypothetical protein
MLPCCRNRWLAARKENPFLRQDDHSQELAVVIHIPEDPKSLGRRRMEIIENLVAGAAALMYWNKLGPASC